MKKFLAIATHVISGLGNDLLGWVVIISFELTGSEGKFQDDVFHWIIFACGLILAGTYKPCDLVNTMRDSGTGCRELVSKRGCALRYFVYTQPRA